MKRRLRTFVLAALASLAVAFVALWLWLPWNPFETDAGPLDEWVPEDADAVIRLDAGALGRAAVLRTLWDGPAGARLREESDLDDLAGEIRAADARLADLPLPLSESPTVARDFAGREVLVALRGDEVLVMTRLTGLGKAIELLRRAGDEVRAQSGVRIEEGAFVVRRGEGPEIRAARRRDVLVVSASKALFDEAISLADRGGRSIAMRADYRELRPLATDDARVAAWIDAPVARRIVGHVPIADARLQSVLTRPVKLDVDARAADEIRIALVLATPRDRLLETTALREFASRLALPGEAFAHGALPISARDAVGALFNSQPPSRRRLADEMLAEKGSSMDAVVGDLARHFDDGVGFVVARLPETDALKLDDADGDPAEPIPATIAVFRLADPDAARFLADLERHAEALFGDGTRLVEEPGPRGERLFRADAASLGPEWRLLRPAFAVTGDHVVFSTNDRFLTRALAASAGTARPADPATVAALGIDAAVFKRRLDDLRWENASRATYHDWAAERRALRAEFDRTTPSPGPAERQRLEDSEIVKRVLERKTREFPDAVRAWRDSLAWMDAFTRLDVTASSASGSVRVDARIAVRVR